MKFIRATILAALAATIAGAFAPHAGAAPLPTNLAAMKPALDTSVVQVRYGRWHGGWGYRGGWGGYRGWGHRGWGLGAAAAGAIVGGAIASSAYYGGAYPYYGEGYAYSDGYGSDYCQPYSYGGYYPGYRARRYYYGW